MMDAPPSRRAVVADGPVPVKYRAVAQRTKTGRDRDEGGDAGARRSAGVRALGDAANVAPKAGGARAPSRAPNRGEDGRDRNRHLPAFPSEVLATIGAFCCRSSLDAFAASNKRHRDVCGDAKQVAKPWPTNYSCSLVEAICPDLDDLPVEPEGPDEYLGINFDEDIAERRYIEELRDVIPPPSQLVVLHDASGSSFISLYSSGIRLDRYAGPCVKPHMMQIWSKEHGLMFEETQPYFDTKIAITPPLGDCGIRFAILPVYRHSDAPGVRMVEMCNLPSRIVKSFGLPARQHVQSAKCIGGNGLTYPSLIFMDRGESAVKLCRILLSKGEGREGDGSTQWLRLTEPKVITSDPSRTGDLNTRRSSLASFSNSKRTILAFSYDFEDIQISIYDIERETSVVVPTPEGAGWIRDAEFSPDGKALVLAHNTNQHGAFSMSSESSCAISIYDCDVDRIEDILQRPTKFYHIKEKGYCDHISFSPKGTKLAFRWIHDGDDTPAIFHTDKIGMIDLSSALEGNNENGKLSIDFFDEVATWERFASS